MGSDWLGGPRRAPSFRDRGSRCDGDARKIFADM
jgi:hypothetical protein